MANTIGESGYSGGTSNYDDMGNRNVNSCSLVISKQVNPQV